MKVVYFGILVPFFCLVSVMDAGAMNYDFSSYDPTLTSFYPSTTPIDSYYTLAFDSANASESDNDFVYKQLNDDGTITDVYYKIVLNNNVNRTGALLARIGNATQGQQVEGYFYNLSRAINTTKKMGNITADFFQNKFVSSTSNGAGAAFVSSGNGSGTGVVTGDFIENYINVDGKDGSGNGYYAAGGAMYLNRAILDAIKGNFIGNSAVSLYGKAYGGAIHTTNIPVEITTIEGKFIGNYIFSGDDSAIGGAINMGGKIDNLTGVFVANHAETQGITKPNGSSVRNVDASGGALYLGASANIGNIHADFYSNYVKGGGYAWGGAIYNASSATPGVTPPTITGNFISNYAQSTNTSAFYALGGAVYTNRSITFSADNRDMVFTNNYTDDRRGKNYNSIFVATSNYDQSLNFKVANDGMIVLNDGIIGASNGLSYNNKFDINIEGDGTGEVAFNANVVNADKVNVKNTTLRLGSYDHKDSSAKNSYGHGLFLPGSGTAPVTSLSLDGADLVMDYDSYQELDLVKFAAKNDSYLSFGATFGSGGSGTSDAIKAAATEGSINLRRIKMGDEADVGDSVKLFSDAAMNIGNINEFTVVYKNHSYTFSHDGNNISVATKSLGDSLPYYISPTGTLDIENVDFDNKSTKGIAVNDNELVVADSVFSNNSNQGNSYNADGDGGVILNRDGKLDIVNSDFKDNSANGLGGAIYSAEDFTIMADGYDSIFSGNSDKNGANDIYMEAGKELYLHAINGGSIVLESGINGENAYNLNVAGDQDSKVVLNSKAENVENVVVGGTTLELVDEDNLNSVNLNLKGGNLDIANGKTGFLNLKDLSSDLGQLTLDVDPETNSADVLNIQGDLSGTVNLVLNVLSTNRPTDNILFATTPNDDETTQGNFDIYRVIGSPYSWETLFNKDAKEWYLFVPNQVSNVTSEVMAYMGLTPAALEQTRSLISSVKNKAAADKKLYKRCGVYDERYCGKPLYNAWVNPIYHDATIRGPVHLDADVHGLEAGFDTQIDAYNKIGLFASYRKGDYDLNGEGEKISSKVGSSIDIRSYTGGLYYRYDRQQSWIFATAYAGVQNADIRTKDGIKADTDGMQMGGGLEVGHLFGFEHGITVEPSLGVFYTQIDFDNVHDMYGKTAKYNTVRQTEIEAGVKFEKTWNLEEGHAKLYFKPSLIEPITGGDRVEITGFDNKLTTYHDGTLGRVEAGGTIALTDNVSGYGFVNHTFGSKYQASSVGLGLNISW